MNHDQHIRDWKLHYAHKRADYMAYRRKHERRMYVMVKTLRSEPYSNKWSTWK
jgi:hypothetical protein